MGLATHSFVVSMFPELLNDESYTNTSHAKVFFKKIK